MAMEPVAGVCSRKHWQRERTVPCPLALSRSVVIEVPCGDGVPGGVGGLVAPRAGLGELGRAIGGPEAVGGYWYSKPPVAANSFVPKLAFVT